MNFLTLWFIVACFMLAGLVLFQEAQHEKQVAELKEEIRKLSETNYTSRFYLANKPELSCILRKTPEGYESKDFKYKDCHLVSNYLFLAEIETPTQITILGKVFDCKDKRDVLQLADLLRSCPGQNALDIVFGKQGI